LYASDLRRTKWGLLLKSLNKRNKPLFPDNFVVIYVLLTDKQEMVDKFNPYFTSIGTDLAGTIPASHTN